jgi:hypothetical protein
MKKRQWLVHRHVITMAEAQQRWDHAYQYLVQWSAASLRGTSHENRHQERTNESSDVCAGFYAEAGASAHTLRTNESFYYHRASTRDGNGKTSMCFEMMASVGPLCVVPTSTGYVIRSVVQPLITS